MSNYFEQDIDWQTMSAKLSAPFQPDDVDFRPQGKPSSNGNVQVVAYVDARTVMARLDEAVGPGNWSFTWEPVVIANNQVKLAKGRLTICGVVREDIGEESSFDPSKGCISDTLKRVAVQFGVARYLYDIERTWVKAGNGDRLSDEVIKGLRERLPRPDGTHPAERKQTTTSRVIMQPPTENVTYNGKQQQQDKQDSHDPEEPATKDQIERMRKYRNALNITDAAIATTDMRLRYGEAESRIAHYIAQWQKQNQRGQREEVAR